MTIVAFLIGLLLPGAAGWLMLSIIEGQKPVLQPWERATMGLLLGLSTSMVVVFIAAGFFEMPLTRLSLLLLHVLLILALSVAAIMYRSPAPIPPLPPSPPLQTWQKWLFGFLTGWTALKILLIGGVFALAVPSFLDDSLDNWNLRGKVFHATEQLTLVLPGEDPETSPLGVSSYPPTVPLAKTWLAALNGEWNEGLINSVHLVWFALALGLIYAFLRRLTSKAWAIAGLYGFASLPLVFMHGTNAYADAFLATHLLLPVGCLAVALARTGTEDHAATWMRISAFGIALVPVLKNEGLLLYFPVLVLAWLGTLWMLSARRTLDARRVRSLLLHAVVLALVIAGPWLLYKWMNGLTFGNAKSVDSFDIGWQSGVLQAVFLNTFFEANWIFLFPLLLILLVWQRTLLRTGHVLVVALFIGTLYFGQLTLYLFTSLSAEALTQTGYARGLVQLSPLLVLLTSMLLAESTKEEL